jgi:hypothetical protein
MDLLFILYNFTHTASQAVWKLHAYTDKVNKWLVYQPNVCSNKILG